MYSLRNSTHLLAIRDAAGRRIKKGTEETNRSHLNQRQSLRLAVLVDHAEKIFVVAILLLPLQLAAAVRLT